MVVIRCFRRTGDAVDWRQTVHSSLRKICSLLDSIAGRQADFSLKTLRLPWCIGVMPSGDIV